MALLLLAGACLSVPDVVLLSVDTLRADRLGCYGCEGGLTPNVDRFAAESLVFEDCVCEVPLTSPSFVATLVAPVSSTSVVKRVPRTMAVADGVSI